MPYEFPPCPPLGQPWRKTTRPSERDPSRDDPRVQIVGAAGGSQELWLALQNVSDRTRRLEVSSEFFNEHGRRIIRFASNRGLVFTIAV